MSVAPRRRIDQIVAQAFPAHPTLLMPDETPEPNTEPLRRQPPVPLALAAFAASVLGFMIIVTGIFTLMRYLDGR